MATTLLAVGLDAGQEFPFAVVLEKRQERDPVRPRDPLQQLVHAGGTGMASEVRQIGGHPETRAAAGRRSDPSGGFPRGGRARRAKVKRRVGENTPKISRSDLVRRTVRPSLSICDLREFWRRPAMRQRQMPIPWSRASR